MHVRYSLLSQRKHIKITERNAEKERKRDSKLYLNP
jgi:hypothetical protein